MGIIEEINAELNYLHKMKVELEREKEREDVMQAWDDRLIHRRATSGKDYFYRKRGYDERQALGKQELWFLVFIKYLKESAEQVEWNIGFLQKVLAEYREYRPDNVYSSMKNPYKLALNALKENSGPHDTDMWYFGALEGNVPILSAANGLRKLEEMKEKKGDCGTDIHFKDEGLRHIAGDGTKVRSKSEASIADHLRLNKLKYQYEPILRLGDQIIRPDFGIDCAGKKKTVYWEHLGMMQNPRYAARAAQKLTIYFENGFVPLDNLIITTEWNGNLNTGTIQRMIDLVLL